MIPVEISNPKVDRDNQTFLSEAHANAVTTLNVKNGVGLDSTGLIMIGEPGVDRSEIVVISAATYNTLTVSAIKFPHPANTPVRIVKYNQIKVYVSTTGLAGAYSLDSTIDITPDRIITVFYDADGDASYYYKVSYFNSSKSWETPQSSAIPGTGITFYSLKKMGERVITLFGDTAQKVLKPLQVYDWLNEINQKLELVAIRADKNYIITPLATQAFSSGVDKYAKPDNFFHLRRLDVSYTTGTPDSSFKKAKRTQINTGQPTDVISTENPKYYDEGDNWVFKPSPTAGGYRAWYVPIPTVLESPTDEPRTFLKPYTDIYTDYCMMRAYEKYKMLVDAAYYRNKVRNEKVDLITDMKDLGLDQADKMEITDRSDFDAMQDEVI
jgi:hypothetical protein